jgi:glutathione reductase (NADPH)
MGLEVVLEAPVVSLAREGEGILVRAGAGGEQEFRAEKVVHGAGRRPALEGLDLEAAGVEATGKGIVVNEFYQSVSNPLVYAAGDVIDRGYPLTPTAVMEAEACAHNIIKGNSQGGEYLSTPSVAFTDPPLARVGLNQDQAKKEGREFQTRWAETGDWAIFKRLGQRYGGYKVLIETGTDRILGAHLLGHGAEEVINLFALAIRHGLTASQLKKTVCSYPSHGYELRHMLP